MCKANSNTIQKLRKLFNLHFWRRYNPYGSLVIQSSKDFTINLNFREALAIRDFCRSSSERMEEKKTHYEKVPVYWSSAGFAEEKSKTASQDKMIVEAFGTKPLKVIFVREEDKVCATAHDPRFDGRNWQDLAYIADVEVISIAGKPKVYHVTRLYPEETFDPAEDDNGV